MPYRTNTAPPIKPKWDGSYAAGIKYDGAATRLVIASNGKLYHRDTGEEVETMPLGEFLRRARGAR